MNIPRVVSSLVTNAGPTDGGSVADAGRAAATAINDSAPPNRVDAFSDGGATVPLYLLPQCDGGSPLDAGVSIPASALQRDGGASLRGPIVLAEPISTETVPRKAATTMKPVTVEVPWYSQFEDHGAVKGGPTSCNATVKEMLANAAVPSRPGGKADADNINIAVSKDQAGRINPSPAKAAEALGYIDSQLEHGQPVMVGVTWRTPSPGYNGGNADHYVVITGRGVDDDGRTFYTFHDPGSRDRAHGADTRPQNRFFVDDATGMLFRPGQQRPPGQMYSTDARYEVSQVRKNQ